MSEAALRRILREPDIRETEELKRLSSLVQQRLTAGGSVKPSLREVLRAALNAIAAAEGQFVEDPNAHP